MKTITQRFVAVLLATMMGICMASAQTKTVKHTVERGETLASIAKRYGTTNEKIIELNPDASQFIYVGMELTVPVTTVSNQSDNVSSTESSYTLSNKDYKERASEKDVLHEHFIVAQYQLGDFRDAKYTSCYGIGVMFTSFTHWNSVHLGANMNILVNKGYDDNWGSLIDFGPSVRIDLSENLFVNIPLDVRCVATFPDSDIETNWGLQLAPALHVFLSQKFGIFIGPQTTIGFDSGSKPSFGLVAGLSFEV